MSSACADADRDRPLDLVGIGLGPSNLSLAALAAPLAELRGRFFERRRSFAWHPGLLFPDSTITVSFVKDLVTLVDPTSPYSFLSFLASQRRLYQFVNADLPSVSRWEFDQYYRWVSGLLPSVRFGREARAVRLDGGCLVVDLGADEVRTRNVVVGTGPRPKVPAFVRPHLGPRVLHAERLLIDRPTLKGRSVVVVGGGQTGAEVFAEALADRDALPLAVHWVTRRTGFLALDESPFADELFAPGYSEFFYGLDAAERARLLEEQKLASDGITQGLLQRIYRKLYELDHLAPGRRVYGLHAGWELTALTPRSGGWLLDLEDRARERRRAVYGDVIVLCTGYESVLPDCLAPLRGAISMQGDEPTVRRDFSLEWDGPPGLGLYVQNGARSRRGIADPNLGLTPWRSAVILNSVLGREVYDLGPFSSVFDWNGSQDLPQQKGTTG